MVLISRWTYIFLILHNLTALASYGAYIASKPEVCSSCVDTAVDVKIYLDEVLLFLIVLAVPGSYLIAWLCQCVCGIDDDRSTLEMDKIDKVYQEVTFYNFCKYVCLNLINIGKIANKVERCEFIQPSFQEFPDLLGNEFRAHATRTSVI